MPPLTDRAKFERRLALILLGILAVLAGIGFLLYSDPSPQSNPLVFSPVQVLASSWYRYKDAYIDSTYRTIDWQRDGVTTSEGQSYTMLRSVWQADRETFDGTWQWTQTNLQHSSDHLFSWIWGERPDGTFGVLAEQSGENSASDADTDIALALILAYARWQDPAYLTEARLVINDIWEREVVLVNGKPYLAANDVEKDSGSQQIVINPSYFNPAAYHLFAIVDTSHPWEMLRKQSYAVLSESFAGSALPPNWISVDRTTGATSAAASHDSNFGFDALRIPFRIALDAQWFNNPDAIRAVRHLSFLSNAWRERGAIASTYAQDGAVLASEESPAMYGGVMGYFLLADPEAAVALYREKLLSLYNSNTGTWYTPLPYYADNWAWFGIALYNRLLPNLAANLPATAFSE